MSNRIRTTLLTVITIVWAANFVAPLFVKKYVPPPEVHLIFMAVIAGVIKAGERNTNRDNDSEDETDVEPRR